MAKVFAPIMDCLPTNAQRHWDNDLLDLLENFEQGDEYTYTTRVSVPEEEQATMKAKLQEQEGTEDLIKFFEENSWDVSFIVDCW